MKNNNTRKSKLTLWVEMGRVRFGKAWAKRHHESLSQLLSDYLLRLEHSEKETPQDTPFMKKLSGVLKSKKANPSDYDRYLEQKYS